MVKYATLTRAERRHSLVGPPEVWQKKRDLQIRFLKEHGLQPHHRLLDFGCGTLRGGIPIIEYLEPGNYYGVEISEDRLAEAQQELDDHKLLHKSPTLTTDIRTINSKFDFILAFAVVDHMTDETLRHNFVEIILCLDGVFYADASTGQHITTWQEYPYIHRSFEQYATLANENDLVVRDLGTLGSLGDSSGYYEKRHMMEFRLKHATTAG